ncbi:MAG: glycosyl hydrolase [Candidatus Margulisiibacteriota bacterium]|jgi:hypothetical protein
MLTMYQKFIFSFIFILIITLTGCDSINNSLNLPNSQFSDNNEVIMDKQNIEPEILSLINTYSSYQSELKFTANYNSIIKINPAINLIGSKVTITLPKNLSNLYLFRKKNNNDPWQNISLTPGPVNILEDTPIDSGNFQYLILAFSSTSIYYCSSLTVSYQISSLIAKKIDFNVTGCYLGFSSEATSVASFSDLASKKPALSGIFISFSESNSLIYPQKYLTRINEIKNAGAIPFITWEPWDYTKPNTNLMPYILAGSYDDLIDNWAQVIASLDYPVVIRFAHEMNGNWYPWSNDANLYKNAFKYVVNKFKAKGAHNVSWCFAPNWDNAGTGRNYYDYFPGASYVDCLGISGYNSGTTQSWSIWRDFATIYQGFANELYNRYKLPIIIDVASVESGGNKALWITDMADKLKTNNFNMIKGMVWFQYDKYESGISTDWRINSSDTSLASFKNLTSSYFLSEPVIENITIR